MRQLYFIAGLFFGAFLCYLWLTRPQDDPERESKYTEWREPLDLSA